MMDISAHNEKLEIALQQKSNPSYKTKIEDELSKPEWQERLFGIERTLSNIKDEKDFLEYQKSLTKLFNDLYEVITAPGVDYFIGWVNQITAEKSKKILGLLSIEEFKTALGSFFCFFIIPYLM